MRLVNRNNCVASKQASKLTQIYYMYTPGRYAEDSSAIPRPGVFALGAWRKGHPTNDTLSREW